MSSENTENKKNETVDPKATKPETVVNTKPAEPKSPAPTETKQLGLDALDFDNIVPRFTSDPETPVDRNENVCERALKAISNGVQTQMRGIEDENGELIRDRYTHKIKQVPIDPKQCRVWQSRYQAVGQIKADIQFPNNSGAEALEQLCQDHNRVILYTIHRVLLDTEGNEKPLPSNPNKNQHGHYMLAIILPQAHDFEDANGRMVPDPAGSPRDQFLRDFKQKIPEFPSESIGIGEKVFTYLINNTPNDEDWDPNKKENQVQRDNQTFPQTGLQKTKDLISKLTVPSFTGDRNIAKPEDMIFLRANSGFDQLYINVKAPESKGQLNRKAIQITETKTVGNMPDHLNSVEN